MVMSFSPPVVGLLTKSSQKGGGGSGSPGPSLATPLFLIFLSSLQVLHQHHEVTRSCPDLNKLLSFLDGEDIKPLLP